MTDFDKTGRYRGEVLRCRKEGTGQYVYPGDVYVYEGPWVDGEKHGGNARFSLPGYSEFQGDFLNGEITGKGKKTWADGRSYEGQWENGEMHGKGSWRGSDGLETYEGEFANNRREGSGSLCLRNGDRYTGQFHLHKFHGHGSYLRENVVFVESDFQGGVLSGRCRMQWHKVASYTGECSDNKLSGLGHFRCLDGSFEMETRFLDNRPLWRVNGYDLQIDRSSCVEENPDPKGKDKKKEKDKKKPAGKKGSSVVDVDTLVSLSPGQPIGALSISLLYSDLEDSSASMNLPNPSETRRALSITLREYTPQSATDDADSGLGEAVSLWKRPSTLEECAVAWERFPPRCLRFINGANPLTGDRMTLEGAPEFSSSFDPITAVVATQLSSQTSSSVLVTVLPDNLPAPLSSLSFILDFKLMPSPELFTETSPLRTRTVNAVPFLSLPILCWGLSGGDDRLFTLSLLIPTNPSPTCSSWTGCLWEVTLHDSVLSRWSDSHSFDIDQWHSVGLSLSANLEESHDGKGMARVSLNLFVDGAGRMKVDKGEEAVLSELSGFLCSEAAGERLWKIGGSGTKSFDGLIKSLAICTESDRCDLQEVTSCFSALASQPLPSTEETADPLAPPPGHTVVSSVSVLSCAGRAFVPPSLTLPTSLPAGFYVLEVTDKVDERCRQQSDLAKASREEVPYAEMCRAVPCCLSSKTQFKISVN